MDRKTEMDAFGAAALIAFALHLAFNQVVIKVTNGGFGPIFAAGLRSAGAVVVLLIWMRLRGISLSVPRSAVLPGILAGMLFALEFACLFTALDFTTVSRASVIFYSMPMWLALTCHFLIPGDRLTGLRSLGFLLAMGAHIAHPPQEDGWAPGYYSVLFEDPEGIRLEANFVPGKGLLS